MGLPKYALILATLAILIQAQQPANNPGTCNVDNGKHRMNTKGETYKINCNFAADGPILQRGARPNLGAHIDACGLFTGCASIDYNPTTRECNFLSATTRGTRASPGIHNAYLEQDPSIFPPPGPDPNPGPSSGSGLGGSGGSGASSASGSQSSGSPSSGTGSGASTPSSGTTPSTSSSATNPPSGGPGPGPTDHNIEMTTEPSCLGTNGKVFKVDDGTYYKIACGRYAGGNTLATIEGVSSFAACMTKCSETNGCISVQ